MPLQPQLQRRLAITGLADLVAEDVELAFQQHQVGGVVVHHQYVQCPTGCCWFACRQGGLLHGRHRQLQFDVDPRAATRLAGQAQAATHQFAQGAADHQAQAGALAHRLVAHLSEVSEQPRLVFGADADAAVFHAQQYPP
ncbi:hypothetical protein D3C81_629600 [compost metagenome]